MPGFSAIVGVPHDENGLTTSDLPVTQALREKGGDGAVTVVAEIATAMESVLKDAPRHPLSKTWHSMKPMTVAEKQKVLDSVQFGDNYWIQLKGCQMHPLGVSIEYKEGKGHLALIFDFFAAMSLGGKYDGYLRAEDPNLVKIMKISSREDEIKKALGENAAVDDIYIWKVKGKEYRVKIKYISSGDIVVAQEVDDAGKWIGEDSTLWGGINSFYQEATKEER